MADGVQYLLPEGTAAAAVDDLLAGHLDVEGEPARFADRTFLDTFDGRLHAAGLALVHEDGRLALVEGYRDRAAAALAALPEKLLVGDLPPGPLRDALEPIVDVRALLPTVRIRGRVRSLRVVDDEGKTVVRLVADAPERLEVAPRLHVIGVRGYDKALRRVRRTLDRELGLAPARAALQDEAVAAAGGTPGGVSSKLDVALRPAERADRAAATVLARLAATIEANLPGTLADIDIEFLHDLRVAVRRTRSVQRELKRTFPPDRLRHFRAEFRWLQQVTGPTRDLDVQLLEPAVAKLRPLRALLVKRRRRERQRMVRALRSARAERLLADWSVFVAELPGLPADDRPDARRPIGAVAGGRIAAVYRGMVKMGSAIDDASPAEALHELRKKGKELRYLLELFGGLFGADVTKPMIRTLKALQDTLGRFQDREVQADLLRSLAGEVGDASTIMAMGVLVERLISDQHAARAEFAERFSAFAAPAQGDLVTATFA